MPCTVTPEEEAWYERQLNKKHFGEEINTENLVTRIACEFGKLIKENDLLSQCSPLAKKWLKWHEEEDKNRQEK